MLVMTFSSFDGVVGDVVFEQCFYFWYLVSPQKKNTKLDLEQQYMKRLAIMTDQPTPPLPTNQTPSDTRGLIRPY